MRSTDREGAPSDGDDLVVAAPLRVEACAVRAGAPGLRVARIGMGHRRAKRAAARLRSDPARAVAVAGVCGATRDDLAPGDVVVAEALLGPAGQRIDLDAAPLVAALAALGIAARVGVIEGVERLIGGPTRAVVVARGACAVDMESYWLADAAAGRPFAVLRVVSDGPHHELWGPGIVRNGITALRRLRDAAPALVAWAADL